MALNLRLVSRLKVGAALVRGTADTVVIRTDLATMPGGGGEMLDELLADLDRVEKSVGAMRALVMSAKVSDRLNLP